MNPTDEEPSFAFPKPRRIVDEELLSQFRLLPCMGCFKPSHPHARNHPHHVTSRGAGGDDVPRNLIPLCPPCHQEIHQHGNKAFAKKHGAFRYWCKSAEREDCLE
jgi:hypothetical protein